MTRIKKSNSRMYWIWQAMKDRCLNSRNTRFKYYGGIGITISDSWMTFENFYSDMGEKPMGKSLEMVDSTKGYCKENCIWASVSQQVFNRRITNKTGLPRGVTRTKNGKYSVIICIKKSQYYLGTFDNMAEASNAYLKMFIEWHGKEPAYYDLKQTNL